MRTLYLAVAFTLTQLVACGGSSAPSGGLSTYNPPVAYSPPPNYSGDNYEAVGTNPFVATLTDPLSTFGVDVDTASYDIFRRDIGSYGRLPDADSVRVEEYINNFSYNYPTPEYDAEQPFTITLDSAPHLLDRGTHVLRVGIQAAAAPVSEQKKPANLVFLIDVSGSMTSANKLPLVKQILTQTLDVLEDTDTVSIVTYAGATRVAMPPTPVSEKDYIASMINSFQSGGSTAGAAGINLAYQQAQAGFIDGGLNHIILCSDGDFNVGISDIDVLEQEIEEKRTSGITFTVLGFGSGNLNDALMERLSNAGNGVYGVISSAEHASRYVENRMLSNLIYVAKDMKLQLEFNPSLVSSYRLIGYENRDIDDDEFRDDKVDAGEIGAGHNVTALYELVLAGNSQPQVEGAPDLVEGDVYDGPVEVDVGDYVLVKIRYKDVEAFAEDPAYEVTQSLASISQDLDSMDDNFKWAVAMAAFAEILKDSPYADTDYLVQIEQIFQDQSILDEDKSEFYSLFQTAAPLIAQ